VSKPLLADGIKRFVSRYATFAAARIALVVGRWFVLVQSARHLPTADFAVLAATLSLVEILRAISDVGADSYVYSRLGHAHQPLRFTVRGALWLRAVASLATVVVGASAYWALGGRAETLPIFVLILASCCQATGVALLQKSANFRAMAGLVGATLLASLSVDILAWLQTPQLWLMACLLVAPDCIAAVVALSLAAPPLRRMLAATMNGRHHLPALVRPIATKLGPAAAIGALVVAYSRLDVLVVLPLAGVVEQASYSAGFRLIEPAFLFFAIASLALLAELGSGKTENTKLLARRLLNYPPAKVALGLIAASATAAMLAYWLAEAIFRFSDNAALLAGVFAAALPYRLGNSMVSALLLRLGRFDAVMHAAVLNGLITFSLAMLFTHHYGAAGAAMAALLGEIFNAGYQRYRLKKQVAADPTPLPTQRTPT